LSFLHNLTFANYVLPNFPDFLDWVLVEGPFDGGDKFDEGVMKVGIDWPVNNVCTIYTLYAIV
jgi:hypothetical protein